MTEDSKFIDYYETLEISPNANSGTIDRMFRYLAQRYHPDNGETADRLHFDLIMAAYNILRDPARRVQYDIQHKKHSTARSKLAEDASNTEGIGGDADIENKLLSILYVKRRQSIVNAGIGNADFERLLGCPTERLEFHLWYLKEKGWIVKTKSGAFAITAEGVDRVNFEHNRKTASKLLTDRREP